MATLEGIKYSCTRSQDGTIYSETLEMRVDTTVDTLFLNPEQIQQFNDLADQTRNCVLAKYDDWPISKPKAGAPATPKIPDGYVPERKKWTHCPTCGNTTIDYKSIRDGSDYQKCQKCRTYLNEDGTTKVMPPPPARAQQ
jgi:hypothetical protein